MTKDDKGVVLAIAVPTYNEAKNIPKLTAKIKAAVEKANIKTTLLIIDDNSPDGTGEVADKLAASEKGKTLSIKVLHRQGKEGLGKAYIEGFNQLLKGDYTHILQMDADLSHDPKYIPAFVAAVTKADFVVGSRYIKGGDTPDWAWYRKLQSRFGNVYARIFLGSKIHDYTGGYNLYSKQLLKKIGLDSLQAGGYGFLIELKYRAVLNSTGIHEVPIVFMDRLHGTSKIPRSTILKNFMLVPQLVANNRKDHS
jgi:dolichol-phosphate mannosyltransferase